MWISWWSLYKKPYCEMRKETIHLGSESSLMLISKGTLQFLHDVRSFATLGGGVSQQIVRKEFIYMLK